MTNLNKEWESFLVTDMLSITEEKKEERISPKCSDIYISTKTKIVFLNTHIKLYEIFWKIPVTEYHLQEEGVIKKQMKVSMTTIEAVEELEDRLKKEKRVVCDVIQKLDNPNARINKYKDVRKINIGINTKDLIRYRNKKKGAFYNCFALIIRIKLEDTFKEIHVKVFNTGKLEIPGIQNDKMMYMVLEKLISVLQPFNEEKLYYNKEEIDTVLINSNFSCNYIINRNKLFDILKDEYKITSLYDPCSYPGIQSKFYYNKNKNIQDGICNCEKKCSSVSKTCTIVSFMIFRTGSILIVGHCDEMILEVIYNYLKQLLLNKETFNKIYVSHKSMIKKKKVKKRRKKMITIYENK